MKFIVATYGTEGDARPFSALCRGLIDGWSGIDPKELPDNFLVIGDTPHDWLFPRTAAVILHGGSGTSHSAARARGALNRDSFRRRPVKNRARALGEKMRSEKGVVDAVLERIVAT